MSLQLVEQARWSRVEVVWVGEGVVDARQREPLFARTSFVRLQHRIKLFCEKAQLWQWLGRPVIAKLRYFGAQNLPY